jgi:hypothetical protein
VSFCFHRGDEVRSDHVGDLEAGKGLPKDITETAERTGVVEEEASQGEADCSEATLRRYREDL